MEIENSNWGEGVETYMKGYTLDPKCLQFRAPVFLLDNYHIELTEAFGPI